MALICIIKPSEILIEENMAENNQKIEKNNMEATNNGLMISFKAYVGGKELKEGDIVNNGEIIEYRLILQNNSEQIKKDIEIEIAIPKNTTYVKYIKTINEEEDTEFIDDYYEEMSISENILRGKIDNLDIGENNKREFLYEVKVNEKLSDESKIESTISVSYNNETQSRKISNISKVAEIRLNMYMSQRISKELKENEEYVYCIDATNLSDLDISNINIDIKTNEQFELQEICEYNLDEEENNISLKDNKFIITELKAKEKKEYLIWVKTKKGSNEDAVIYAVANNKYNSNKITEKIQMEKFMVEIIPPSQKMIKSSEQSISYNIDVTNIGDTEIDYLEFMQKIPSYLEVQSIKIGEKEVEIEEFDYTNNSIVYEYSGILKIGEKINIKVNMVKLEKIPKNQEIEKYLKVTGNIYEFETEEIKKEESVPNNTYSNTNLKISYILIYVVAVVMVVIIVIIVVCIVKKKRKGGRKKWKRNL